MPLFVHAVLRALAMHGQTVELAAEADCEITDVDHFLDFAKSFGTDFAHFESDELAKRLLVFTEQIT